jgi:two-component system sensor histidine kinase ResE
MRSLFWKVFLANLLTILVALGTVSVLLTAAFRNLYVQRASAQLLTLAADMAAQFEPLLADPSREAELEKARRLMEASSRTRICVLKRSGPERKVFGKGPLGQPGETAGPGAAQVEPGGTAVVSGRVVPCGEDMLLAQWNFPDHQGSLWSLYVRASMTGVVDETVWQLRRLLLLAVVVAVLLALLIGLGLSERISGPLRRMRLLAGEMAKGDFSRRLELEASDEVGALASSFDSLADSLQSTLRQLEQQQARLRGILASVAEGIIAVDPEGHVTLLNPQAASLLRVDQEQAVGSTVSELALPENVSEQFMRCLRTNELCATESELQNPRRHLVVQVAPVRGGATERWGAVAVVRDVTAARRLEAMRRQFISDASHEIKTPLTAIGGFASAIADGTAATPEERSRSVGLIVREVERLNRLVNDLLDLSRIESGAVELGLGEVDLLELTSAAVESFQTQARDKNVEIDVNLPRDLPPVRADSDRIYQVLVNLLSNALRVNPPGGTITVAGRHTDKHVRVDITDTGPGIPPDQLPHIWERFHRADTSRARQEGGTGLGLAIVRSIVEAHGGTVAAESVVGKGSTFTFILPTT